MDPQLVSGAGLQASVFYKGGLCGNHAFSDDGCGHLHIVLEGDFELIDVNGNSSYHSKPSLVLFKEASPHHLNIPDGKESEVICAEITYTSGMNNLITHALTDVTLIALSELPVIEGTLLALKHADRLSPSVRRLIENKLCEVILLQVISHLLTHKITQKGTLSGLSHPVLGPLIAKILKHPGQQWNLEELARSVAMSKTRFAQQFEHCVGVSPGMYIRQQRIASAQKLLLEGVPLELVAHQCGYASQSSFSRAFYQHTGHYPSHWVRNLQAI